LQHVRHQRRHRSSREGAVPRCLCQPLSFLFLKHPAPKRQALSGLSSHEPASQASLLKPVAPPSQRRRFPMERCGWKQLVPGKPAAPRTEGLRLPSR
jgi:hypothetical protein